MPIPCKPNEFLSIQQIFGYLRQAGFDENLVVPFAALVLYESTGCPKAYRIIGENSHGLLQINMNAHGTSYGNRQQLYDILTNLRGALKIYKKQGFNAWKNSYRKYLNNYEGITAKVKAAYTGNNNAVLVDNREVINLIKGNNHIVNDKPNKNNTYAIITVFAILILASR